MPNSNFTVIWEFHVKPDVLVHFEKVYGPEGEWAQLFRASHDFLGTTILRGADQAGRYLTVDRWKSAEALHQFKREHQTEYDALDRRCENLTEREALVGNFFEDASGQSD